MSKTALRSNMEEKTTTTLEIVWRNPDPVRHQSRRHSSKRERDRTLYILQEFVTRGNLSYWTTLSALEMLAGGRAA
jgi:hypothetical protein